MSKGAKTFRYILLVLVIVAGIVLLTIANIGGKATVQCSMGTVDEWGTRSASLYIDDTGGISVPEIRSKCRRLKARRGLDMVVIDYLQLMQSGGGRRSDSRTQEVSDMTRQLKLLARELEVPVVLLAQLNRGPETRQDHTPMIADLRESGSIEQDADMVILLYRPAVYDETEDNTSHAIIAKHRHGPTGTVLLAWQGEYTRFMNLAQENAY